ncbi:probable insulin-like peptide 7 [Lineus longissimus]|uniref:probable insulin-like peptide 7 n=1 Tax=Lineus longissimus TaxID=88925 RepID=UPI002B4C2652
MSARIWSGYPKQKGTTKRKEVISSGCATMLKVRSSHGSLILYAALFIVITCLVHCTEAERFDHMLADFLLRSEDQWRQAWHTDCHRRCRHELDSQIRLACAKDIYRIRRAADVDASNVTLPPIPKNQIFDRKTATAFLHKLHRQPIRMKRGIMEECCYAKSCSWEEYAESCHHYGRSDADSSNICGPWD